MRSSACTSRPGSRRADNTKANHTVPKQPVRLAGTFPFDATWQKTDKPRITGNYRGTTDEIIQWAACKWGWSDNVVRAQAVVESHWHQSTRGDFESRSNGHCPYDITANPCPTSFGIIQVRWYFHPAVELVEGGRHRAIRGSARAPRSTSISSWRRCAAATTAAAPTSATRAGTSGAASASGTRAPGTRAAATTYASRVRNELNNKQWLGWANQG